MGRGLSRTGYGGQVSEFEYARPSQADDAINMANAINLAREMIG